MTSQELVTCHVTSAITWSANDMESSSEKQKILIGVFPDVPECRKAWEVVTKIASSGGDVCN